MRSLLVVLAAAALGVSSALLVGCGGNRSHLIPASAAQALDGDLDDASNALAAQQCNRAQRALGRALDRADRLPSSVDPRLRDNLAQGLSHASERVAAGCRRKTPTVTTPTETVPTQTTTTETTPTPTTTEHTTPRPPPTPTTPSPPTGSGGTPPGGLPVPGGNDGNDNGNGQGNGGGQGDGGKP